MLIVFHCISLFIHLIFKNRKREKILAEFEKLKLSIENVNYAKALATRDAEEDIKFDPPVYKQRYGTVRDVLLNENWRHCVKKVVEFGCAEFGLYLYLKNLIGLQEVDFVDIDEELLNENLYKLQPLTIEYLKRRSEPFLVNVFAGSIIHPDFRILDADAVIGIEIIEHLYPDVLEAVPYAIFHGIQPKIAIFTTPNADFNVLLSNLNGFRHYDHKFEWTREQFSSWANNIILRFPHYLVTLNGIGCGPEGTETLGCCSQMAVFIRKDLVDPTLKLPIKRCFCSGDMEVAKENSHPCPSCFCKESHGICTYYSYTKHISELKESSFKKVPEKFQYYKLLETIEHPFEIDSRSPETRMMDEIKYKIYEFGSSYGRFFNVDLLRSEIPLLELTYGTEGQFIKVPELRSLLEKFGYKIEECISTSGDKESCLIYEPEMENSPTSESDASDYESGQCTFVSEASLSDWDDDTLLIKRKDCDKKGHEKNAKSSLIIMEENKRQFKSLLDSGFQKSLSILDDSAQTALVPVPDHILSSCLNLSDNSPRNKLKGKRTTDIKHEFSPTESLLKEPRSGNRPRIDSNKINELDSLGNQNQYYQLPLSRTFISHLIRPQTEFLRKTLPKDSRDHIAGPSNIKRKKKMKKSASSDSEDEKFDDVKSIANCILENTLNKIPIKGSGKLIEDLRSESLIEIPSINETDESVSSGTYNERKENKNDDNQVEISASTKSDENTESEDHYAIIEDINNSSAETCNFFDNISRNTFNEMQEMINIVDNGPDADLSIVAQGIENDMAQASREALFDPNSQVDLLEDFEIPPLLSDMESVHNVSGGPSNNIVLIGVSINREENDAGSATHRQLRLSRKNLMRFGNKDSFEKSWLVYWDLGNYELEGRLNGKSFAESDSYSSEIPIYQPKKWDKLYGL